MSVSRRSVLWLMAILSIGTLLFLGQTQMNWFSSHERDLKGLLSPAGEALVDDGTLAAWQPDPNYKAQAYYLTRRIDEAGFQRLVQPTGLEAGPPPQVPEAVWELPPGVALKDWTAQDVPPGAGLQANGALGATIVWLKWYEGRMFLVATVSSP